MRPLLTLGFALISVASFDHEFAAAAMPQGDPSADSAADKPLTGRPIRCEQGKIGRFECSNVELLSYLPASTLAGSTGNDVWGWHDSTTGREFVLVGGASTAFVEVTDPVNPKYLGVLPPHEGITEHAAQSVKVYGHYALVGYEGADHGMQIFDLTQLRDVKNAPVEFKETAHYDEFGNSHTITVDQESGFAYANGTGTCGGLHMMDMHNPTKPTFVGCYANDAEGGAGGPGYVHDTQCLIYRGPDQQYKGREICLNSSGSAVVVVDVTDKKNPKTVSVARYPNVGFAHQGWLTEDQRYFFLDDEFDEGAMAQQVGKDKVRTRTLVFDLNDLDDPVVLTEYFNPTTTSTDHNLYIRGRYMYQGNYGAGLRIIDVADPKTPKEVGYLTNIGGAWGTYPYFKNDVVAVSTGSGLFLARLLSQ